MTEIDYRERVTRGADLLDGKKPGWHTGIDLVRLNQHAPEHCVLGQLFGSYRGALKDFGLDDSAATAHGFRLDDREYFALLDLPGGAYADLTTAWLNLISERRDNDTRGALQ